MSVTTLDPRTALVVIDLQQGIVGLPTVHPARRSSPAAPSWPPASARRACLSCW